MAVRVTLVLSLLLLSSILSATSSPLDGSFPLTFINSDDASDDILSTGKIGDFVDEELGADLDALVRRGLAGNVRYISYDALKKDRVPCNRRGNSYYNCMRTTRANPYRRGCSIITRCKKIYN
ncbi:hypothetical protein LUZ60_014469 [Juncus effusus]|nr:hypothetical protein LUZ60_014469 [Juncus effusus]